MARDSRYLWRMKNRIVFFFLCDDFLRNDWQATFTNLLIVLLLTRLQQPYEIEITKLQFKNMQIMYTVKSNYF